MLKTELELRIAGETELSSALNGTAEEKRSLLEDFLLQEAEIDLARRTVSRHERVNALVTKLAGDAISCIPHVEMRVNEKLHWTLLSIGMDRCLDGDNKKRRLFVERVTEPMNATIIGNGAPGRRSQWKLPLKEDGKMVDPRTMTNTHSGKCALGLKSLATLVFSAELDESSTTPQHTRLKNEKALQGWHDIVDCCIPMMAALRSHEDFTDNQIDLLHVQNVTFIDMVVNLLGPKHVANCIHIMGAGHIHCCLSKYRNPHRFSQQGWEALNQKLKLFYFNNTNHGGCMGNNTGDKIAGQHMKPLMRWCQRFTVWKLGHGERLFASKNIAVVEDSLDEGMEPPPADTHVGEDGEQHGLPWTRLHVIKELLQEL